MWSCASAICGFSHVSVSAMKGMPCPLRRSASIWSARKWTFVRDAFDALGSNPWAFKTMTEEYRTEEVAGTLDFADMGTVESADSEDEVGNT